MNIRPIHISYISRNTSCSTNRIIHSSGWIRWNHINDTDVWAWDEVHSDDDPDRAIVNWTLAAGEHTLEIAKREDDTLLDAVLITDDLALDQTTLP